MHFMQGVKSNIEKFDQVFLPLCDACQVLYDSVSLQDEILINQNGGQDGKSDLCYSRLGNSNCPKS